jgi:hypothetical protein
MEFNGWAILSNDLGIERYGTSKKLSMPFKWGIGKYFFSDAVPTP